MDFKPTSVPFTHQDRQWDGRFNVPTNEDLEQLTTGLRGDYDAGRLKYILLSGVEIGTRPQQDDYKIRHVHVAAVFCNRVSKSSILKIGTSRLETVIIWFRGNEICLTPDGAITTSKHSQKSMQPNQFCMKWANCRETNPSNVSKLVKRRRNAKSMTSLSTCED